MLAQKPQPSQPPKRRQPRPLSSQVISSVSSSTVSPANTIRPAAQRPILIPIPISETARSLYVKTLEHDEELVQEFLQCSTDSSMAEKEGNTDSTAQRVAELRRKLLNMMCNPDLIYGDNLTQISDLSVRVDWYMQESPKLAFLAAFLKVHNRKSSIRVILVCRAGPFMSMIEDVLKHGDVSYIRLDTRDKHIVTAGQLEILLTSTEQDSYRDALKHANLVIAFDGSANKELWRRDSKPALVVQLVVPKSIEHVENRQDVTDSVQMKAVMRTTFQCKTSAGLVDDSRTAASIGKRFAEDFSSPERMEAWPKLENLLPEQNRHHSTILAPETPAVRAGQKRMMNEEISPTDSTRNLRPSPFDNSRNYSSTAHTTRMTDSESKKASHQHYLGHEVPRPSFESTEALRKELLDDVERISKLEAASANQLNSLSKHLGTVEGDMERLQTRFQSIFLENERLKRTLTKLESNKGQIEARMLSLNEALREHKSTIVDLKRQLQAAQETQLASSNPSSLESQPDGPFATELHDLRIKAASIPKLEKKLASLEQEKGFFSTQYQQASSAAFTHATTIAALEAQVADLTPRATSAALELRKAFIDERAAMAERALRSKENECASLRRLATRLEDENVALKEREEQRRGMSMSTRASSLPPARQEPAVATNAALVRVKAAAAVGSAGGAGTGAGGNGGGTGTAVGPGAAAGASGPTAPSKLGPGLGKSLAQALGTQEGGGSTASSRAGSRASSRVASRQGSPVAGRVVKR